MDEQGTDTPRIVNGVRLWDMRDVEEASSRGGYHFFDADAKRFFSSRIGKTLYGGRYFVTSEQFHGSDGYTAPRLYTVREIRDDGSVWDIGEFQQYETSREAVAAIRSLLVSQTV